jgi:hypothetical protein
MELQDEWTRQASHACVMEDIQVTSVAVDGSLKKSKF